jgi:hypothetical protein
MERIEELESQIKALQYELRELKVPKHFSFSEYDCIGDRFLCSDAVEAIRNLTLILLSFENAQSPFGDKFITVKKKKKVKELTKEEVKLGQKIIDELKPIVEKYVHIVLNNEAVQE